MSIIDSVERQRAQLEQNLLKLEKALRHWQTWDAEYEALKEDLQGLDDETDDEQIAKLASNFEGDVLDEKEIRKLAGLDTQSPRAASYVINQVEKRQDYVQQNITTLTKQRDATAQQLDELLEPPEPVAGSGLPLSEIIEELDDDDNVISSKVTRPEESTSKIVDTLRKAGIAETSSSAGEDDEDATLQSQSPSELDRNIPAVSVDAVPAQTEKPIQIASPSSAPATAPAASNLTTSSSVNQSQADLIAGKFKPGEQVIEIDDEDEFLGTSAVLPKDESPEDAALRREMLRYHLNEVGSVVAEMDLLEGDSDDDFEDELAGLGDEDDSVSQTSDVSEEDVHGRSTRPMITEDYKRQMLELEARLKGGTMQNLGPTPSGFPADISFNPSDSPRSIASAQDKKGPKKKKSVRFADDLDVASEKSNDAATRAPFTTSEVVAERTVKKDHAVTRPATKPSKPSRFKQARQEAVEPGSTETTKQDGPILANSVMERAQTSGVIKAADPDEIDPVQQQRQLAAHYYSTRNKIIQQQGGFKADEMDTGEGPLMEEGEDGRARKVSRFKAARMNF